MKIAIESTDAYATIGGVPCRLWEGVTPSGLACWFFVALISTDADSRDIDPELLRIMTDARGRCYTPAIEEDRTCPRSSST